MLKITAKYSSKCKECKEEILVGTECYFDPQTTTFLKLTCLGCADEDDSQQYFEAKKNYYCALCDKPIAIGEQAFYAAWLEGFRKIICVSCREVERIKLKRKPLEDLSTPKKDCDFDLCDNQTSVTSVYCKQHQKILMDSVFSLSTNSLYLQLNTAFEALRKRKSQDNISKFAEALKKTNNIIRLAATTSNAD